MVRAVRSDFSCRSTRSRKPEVGPACAKFHASSPSASSKLFSSARKALSNSARTARIWEMLVWLPMWFDSMSLRASRISMRATSLAA